MSVLPLKTTWYFPPLLIALGGYFHGLDLASSGTVDAPADDDADRYVCVAANGTSTDQDQLDMSGSVCVEVAVVPARLTAIARLTRASGTTTHAELLTCIVTRSGPEPA